VKDGKKPKGAPHGRSKATDWKGLDLNVAQEDGVAVRGRC